MALYELLIIGSPDGAQVEALTKRAHEVADAFMLMMPRDFAVLRSEQVVNRTLKASTVAVYFGGDPNVDKDLVDRLEAAKVPIVPVVQKDTRVGDAVPDEIAETNAFFIEPGDKSLEALASVAFEVMGLLHTQRRVFVSYRRKDSREVAIQLHDELTARGFDVFLDTHDIRPGEPFQEMLWHRLSDCDVTIMLDTANYFESKWTKQELGRSQALGIQILRIVWPGLRGSRHLSLSDTISLSNDNLTRKRLKPEIIRDVTKRTEALRSRSIATRHLDLVGRLKIEVEKIGGKFEGIGQYRSISLKLPNGMELEAYPLVGVPTANLLNDIHAKAENAGRGRFPFLVYNHVGIRPLWLAHLQWLDRHISAVRALKVSDAGWELANWDS